MDLHLMSWSNQHSADYCPLPLSVQLEHLSWTGWQAFWLKSFNTSSSGYFGMMLLTVWWVYLHRVSIRAVIQVNDDSDAARWSHSSLLSLIHHYTECVCLCFRVRECNVTLCNSCFLHSHLAVCACLGQQSELCPSVMCSESSVPVHFLQSLWNFLTALIVHQQYISLEAINNIFALTTTTTIIIIDLI